MPSSTDTEGRTGDPVDAVAAPSSSTVRRRRPKKPTAGTISLGALAVVVLLAVIGPWVSPYATNIPSGEPLLPPLSGGHWLGTDNLGFDVLTRVLAGTRTSLFAAVVVTVASALAGLLIGAVAGFAGGWADAVLMRITDLFLAFPATIVAMAIVAALGPSLRSSMIGIAIVWWPLYARIARGEIRRAAGSLHVEAARIGGTRGRRLMMRHTVPTVLPTVLVTASLDIGGVIMVLASLAFIGLGSPAPSPELGLMASAGLPYVLDSWWIPVMPAIAVAVLSLIFNYLGDALRSVLRAGGA
ncbi:ABC transporter permease [Kineosporia sp. J2-2]|uniref:ABC transporter permease n=1 Tax=Kineosporia corallincola TaxID=2835133 RepID=A0ABS5TJ44_9ACTN|nr:ABC transporter permease [Kineosporia corallincola]MBT0770083.1 ABC transporter permease [Kineosporia corallincola]